MTAPTPLIAGNWKMHGLGMQIAEATAVSVGAANARARVAICPPATLLAQMSWALRGTSILTGGQDCRAEPCGAFTGDISAEMIQGAGATFVILGHSERRAAYGETDSLVADKVRAALRAGLEPIVCVGESLDQRKAGRAIAVVTEQVQASLPGELAGKPFAVAYEPIWAIGTGLTPATVEIEEMHRAIRETLVERFGESGAEVAILYGGSVKPDNAGEILHAAEVGGALVGGASLKSEDFLAIIGAL